MLLLIMSMKDDRQRSFVEEMYDKYEKKIYVYALSLLDNRQDAQDCVHNVVLRVMEHVVEFQHMEETDIKQYLMIYCRSEAEKIRYRTRKDRKHLLSMSKSDDIEQDDGQYDIEDDAEDISRLIVNEENARLLRELIRKLKPIYRDVILLRYYYNKPSAQIAKELNISENLVNQRLRRAKMILKREGGQALYEAYQSYT